MNDNMQRNLVTQPKDTLISALEEAKIVYLSVWNMDCSECARFLHEGLSQLHGVVLVDVFYRQGVAVVTYDPRLVGVRDIVEAVAMIGKDVCHYYGAEIIGQSPARQALRL